jgi:dTDP-4-amino-4,6-dideoxygalactose transaminase
MRALGLKEGNEVIVPDLTFAATANAPLFCGARPVFADIDERTFNISHEDILNKITSKTKAIIPVHYGGQSCDMKEILEIAEDHKLSVVEDCAHSLGSEYLGRKTGTFGIMGCFSFYPTKIITTIEGGMITTNDKMIARKLRMLREHCMSRTAIDRESRASWHYDVTDLGYNYRLGEIQAALGISQLKRVRQGILKRVRLAHHYKKKLAQYGLQGIIPPYEAQNRSHIFHLFVVRVKKETAGITRDALFEKLSKSGIGLSVHYPPLHKMSFYKQFVNDKFRFPVAEEICAEIMSLPLYPGMKDEDVDFVLTRIKKA